MIHIISTIPVAFTHSTTHNEYHLNTNKGEFEKDIRTHGLMIMITLYHIPERVTGAGNTTLSGI